MCVKWKILKKIRSILFVCVGYGCKGGGGRGAGVQRLLFSSPPLSALLWSSHLFEPDVLGLFAKGLARHVEAVLADEACFFLVPRHAAVFCFFVFVIIKGSSSPPSESTQRLKQRKENVVCTRTSFESLCHRSVGASTRRFRASCCFVAFVVILESNNIGGLCSKRRKGEWREKQDKSKSIKRRYKVVEGLEVCHAFGKWGGEVDHQGAFASA